MKRINFKVRTTFSAELLFQSTQFNTEPEPEHRPTLTSLYSEYRKTAVCTVFPKPISSARMVSVP